MKTNSNLNTNNSKLPKSKKILVTGTAGLIGYHLAKKLLEYGDTVVCLILSWLMGLVSLLNGIRNFTSKC